MILTTLKFKSKYSLYNYDNSFLLINNIKKSIKNNFILNKFNFIKISLKKKQKLQLIYSKRIVYIKKRILKKKFLKKKFLKKRILKKAIFKKKIFRLILLRIRLLLSLKFLKIFLIKMLKKYKNITSIILQYRKRLFKNLFGFKFKPIFKFIIRKKKIFKKGNFDQKRIFNLYQIHMVKKFLRFSKNKRNLSRKFICFLKPYKFYRTLRFKKRRIRRKRYFRMGLKIGSQKFIKTVLKRIPQYRI